MEGRCRRLEKATLALLVMAALVSAWRRWVTLPVPAAARAVPFVERGSLALPILGAVPPFELVDQTGAAVGSATLAGKAWLANFVFTACPGTCPLQTQKLARLHERLLRHPGRAQVQLVSFSVDPERDSPRVLRAYAERVKADPAVWKFLTGPRAQIVALARDGFKLPAGDAETGASGLATHSTRLVLVDGQARVRGSYDGLDSAEVETAMADLERILMEGPAHRPVVKEVANPPWVAARRQAQLARGAPDGVFAGFRFTDRLWESGITFLHRCVDDGSRTYRSGHYDHGTGLAAADVDGDGLTDLYFVNQVGSNQLWRNLGQGRFEDITAKAGVAVRDPTSVSASFADVDNDGDADLYVTNVRSGNVLFLNDGGGRFRDASRGSGVDYKGHSSAALFFDYDRDGVLDLFVANIGQYTSDEVRAVVDDATTAGKEPGRFSFFNGLKDAFAGHLKPERSESSRLYRGLGGGRFEDVTEALGLKDDGWTGDAVAADFTGDGWPDLYVLNMQGLDRYYVNVEGRRFESRRAEAFPRTPWGSMGASVLDYDRDGRLDLFVTDMHSDMSERVDDPEREGLKSNMQWDRKFLGGADAGNAIFGNALFHARPGGTFEEVSDGLGVETYWPWGPSAGDFNADGFVDLFIASSMNYPYRYAVNPLLLNDRGKHFFPAEYLLGVEPRLGGRTAQPWFEADTKDPGFASLPGLSTEQGRFVVWSALGSRSSVLLDLEGDGDLDIVTSEYNGRPMVLTSDLSEAAPGLHFVKVRLVGRGSNRDGLGAVVQVVTATGTQTQLHDGHSGYLSQSSLPLYFGLGSDSAVQRVEVWWPSGARQVRDDVVPGRLLVIEEPRGEPRPVRAAPVPR